MNDVPARFDQRLLPAMRLLRVTWNPEEAGSPMIHPDRPFGSDDPLGDLGRVLGAEGEAARAAYAATMNALPGFIAAARLAPGSYELDREDRYELGAVPGDHGVGRDGSYTFTADHPAVLRRLAWFVLSDFQTGRGSALPMRAEAVKPSGYDALETLEGGAVWPVLATDGKRPYGEMTYFAVEMAEALGLETERSANGRLIPALEKRMDALHLTTAGALRALLLYGEV